MKHVYENFSCTVFPGFYDSLLYNCDTLYYHDSESLPEGFCWEFVKGGYDNFRKETCKEWVNAISLNFEDNPLGMVIGEYKSMWSPKYYNFETDRIFFEVSVDLRKLKKYCFSTESADFNRYLHEKWSDRDGFWSFVPNNVSYFEEKYKHDKSLVDIMIEYYLLRFVNFESVELDVLEEDWSRIHENVTLEGENGKLWNYEWDNKTEKYIPTTMIA